MAETRTCDRCFVLIRPLRDDAHVINFQVVRQGVLRKTVGLCERCAKLYENTLSVILEPPHADILKRMTRLQNLVDMAVTEGGDDEAK